MRIPYTVVRRALDNSMEAIVQQFRYSNEVESCKSAAGARALLRDPHIAPQEWTRVGRAASVPEGKRVAYARISETLSDENGRY